MSLSRRESVLDSDREAATPGMDRPVSSSTSWPPRRPIVRMVADSVLHDLAHGGPLQLNESKLGRLGAAIARWFETRVAEGSSTESGVEDSWTGVEGDPHEAGLVPVGAKQSGITSGPAFKSAVVILIILAIYRMYRWLNREWRWLARRGGLTT